MKYKKILILGSGALKIGQAGEFDYSGSQAIKALKEAEIEVVLVNPNIATVQTSNFLADKVYFLPITAEFVEKVIVKERPDGLLLSFGGQTALNCGVELFKKGLLCKYKLQVLGTPVEAIMLTEDRNKFAKQLMKIKQPIPESQAVRSEKKAGEAAAEIGYPVMVRAAYTLGGQGSGMAKDENELMEIVKEALVFSPQVLVEKYLHHYKEVEYEVVRDCVDNCVTVCNMENMDPLGIHTGESIVVAPSQTLNNYEYHQLRAVAIEIVRSLKIVGECNVQFALNPKPKKGKLDYYVIEVNARLSRSSALASKATGYPLAYVAAKLALGKTLTEIENQVTKVTQSCFEPALDYLALKIPRWDLNKFEKAEETIGTSMKSVGEVMALGRSFEEVIQKAVRMLDVSREGVTDLKKKMPLSALLYCLKVPTPERLFVITEAIRRKITLVKIQELTGIDRWFLARIKKIVEAETALMRKDKLDRLSLLKLKQLGFSDKRIAEILRKEEIEVRRVRLAWKIKPAIFQIDTLAGEMPAKTNYLYLTYWGEHNDVLPSGKKGVIVLGSGPYCIGSSVEFDWVCVNTVRSLRRYKKQSIIINCNPETVSTDYDICNKLYFEELTFERVCDIYEFEAAEGVIAAVGGQIPNNLIKPLADYGVKILGTQARYVDEAEDRNKFSRLVDKLHLKQPEWARLASFQEARKFAEKTGYPVLIRPSYVLSGKAMKVCFNQTDLYKTMTKIAGAGSGEAITISKFISEAKELELDAVAWKGKIMAQIIAEHVEHAGVHSGDAVIVYPGQKIYLQTEIKLKKIAAKIAQALEINGPFNIQFLAKNNQVQVLEVNLRASRTFPFLSKVTGINLAEMISDVLFGKCQQVQIKHKDFVGVKVPQFSFSRIAGADPELKVEMASTGEAACLGEDIEEAFLKAELSVGALWPKKGVFLSLGGEENKVRFIEGILSLRDLKLPIFATEKTANFLKRNGVKCRRLYKLHEKKEPNLLKCFQKKKVDLAINIVDQYQKKEIDDDYMIRRAAVDYGINLVTSRQKAELFVKSLARYRVDELQIKHWAEYDCVKR